MKNNKTSKSCSSNDAMLMQSQEAPSPKVVHLSADITKLKPSNDGKSFLMSVCPNGRALVVDKSKVISVSTKDPAALVKALNWNGNCDREPKDVKDRADWQRNCRDFRFWSVVLNYGDKTKVAKVDGIRAAKHDDHNALEIKLSTKDFEATGATANDAIDWAAKDLVDEKKVSITLIWKFPIELDRYSLYDSVEKDEDLETIEKAIDAAGLAKALDDENGAVLTLLAPTDNAFANLPPGTVQKLLRKENKSQLANLLKRHVVSGKFDSKRLKKIALSSKNYVHTLAGSRLEVIMRGSHLHVGMAKVVAADVKASNGFLHKIDTVLA